MRCLYRKVILYAVEKLATIAGKACALCHRFGVTATARSGSLLAQNDNEPNNPNEPNVCRSAGLGAIRLIVALLSLRNLERHVSMTSEGMALRRGANRENDNEPNEPNEPNLCRLAGFGAIRLIVVPTTPGLRKSALGHHPDASAIFKVSHES